MAPAVAAAAAAANYSKIISAGLSYPSLANYRYTPYPLPNLVSIVKNNHNNNHERLIYIQHPRRDRESLFYPL